MNVYLVSKQFYEEVFIFGIFSDENLDDALNQLAKSNLDDAKRSKRELESWYENTHKPWAKYHKIDPQKPPWGLTVSLEEYSKSLFTVTEIKLNEVICNPQWLGLIEDDD